MQISTRPEVASQAAKALSNLDYHDPEQRTKDAEKSGKESTVFSAGRRTDDHPPSGEDVARPSTA